MNIIDSVQIKGFWGNHNVNLSFNESFNFIIGPNGSGKSTLLKIVAGVLIADKNYLSSLEFDYIKITLKDLSSRKKPYIEVIQEKETPFFHCQYRIFESSSEKPYLYTLSELDGYEGANRNNYFLRMRLAGKEAASRTLTSHLNDMTSLTWLSVERTNNIESEQAIDPLDIRLEDFSNRLVRYFSALSKQINILNEKFQEKVFLSLLDKFQSGEDGLNLNQKGSSEKQAIIQIFSEFNINKKNYIQKVENHFNTLETLKTKFATKQEPSQDEIMTLFSLHRIEKTVYFWNEIAKQKKEILEPRNKFIEMLNELMQRKELSISERNEITIKTSSGKPLKPHQLSSGEKQVLIILGEALLQEGKIYIYMADEPEISLHVEWQESLAENIKSLNPSAQIIFATHSPDIVGSEGDSIIKIGEHIKNVFPN